MSQQMNDKAGCSTKQPETHGGLSSKKRYEPPAVVEWGSVEDLTQGSLSGTQDGALSGTQGV